MTLKFLTLYNSEFYNYFHHELKLFNDIIPFSIKFHKYIDSMIKSCLNNINMNNQPYLYYLMLNNHLYFIIHHLMIFEFLSVKITVNSDTDNTENPYINILETPLIDQISS